MPDVFSKSKRSEGMSLIRSKNTKVEKIVFKKLRKAKFYFVKHYSKVPGKPDIAVPRKKVAVFIDGDFWHCWQYPRWKNKLPVEYWREKIEKNRQRDKKNFQKLRRAGWSVLRFWEHQVIHNPDKVIKQITNE